MVVADHARPAPAVGPALRRADELPVLPQKVVVPIAEAARPRADRRLHAQRAEGLGQRRAHDTVGVADAGMGVVQREERQVQRARPLRNGRAARRAHRDLLGIEAERLHAQPARLAPRHRQRQLRAPEIGERPGAPLAHGGYPRLLPRVERRQRRAFGGRSVRIGCGGGVGLAERPRRGLECGAGRAHASAARTAAASKRSPERTGTPDASSAARASASSRSSGPACRSATARTRPGWRRSAAR